MLVGDEATPLPCVFWAHDDVCEGKYVLMLAISFANGVMKKFGHIYYFAASRLIWNH